MPFINSRYWLLLVGSLIFSSFKTDNPTHSHHHSDGCELEELYGMLDVNKPKPKRQKEKVGVKTIVIDAGHGGKDPGCAGNPKSESKITLAVALKLGKLLEDNLPDVKVIYTRKTDIFIELYERANIANRNNADLFISIHCNSLPTNKGVRGTEVYVMGLHTSDENLEIAKKVAERENQTVLLESNYKKNYGGYDPKDPATHILLSMAQNVHLDNSIRVASLIDKECKAMKQPSRGVHQAGFVVIRATTMPSMLVETGYLTNAADNAYLQSQNGQQRMAKAIYRAVKSFKYELEGKKKADEPLDPDPDDGAENTQENNGQNTDEQPQIINEGGEAPSKSQIPLGAGSNPTPQKTKGNGEKNGGEKTVITKEKNNPTPEKPRISDSSRPINGDAVITYRVQIISNDRQLPANSPQFKGIQGVQLEISNGRYRYYTGDYLSLEEAKKWVAVYAQKGIKGAFVVKYVNGERVN